jgi:hypothetical protein
MLDLVKLATPLEPVRFPSGRVSEARPLDAEGWAMLRELQQTKDNAGAVLLLKRCCPDVTDEDIATLGTEDVSKIVLYCARQITVAEQIVGESSGETTMASSSSDSPPPTT